MAVFFIAGVTLDTRDVRSALCHWAGSLYGFAAILLITPLFGFALRAIPLEPPEFSAGLVVFATAPTTLGVGAALVRSCRGNDGLATLLMTTTSIISVFTIPLWLKALFAGQAEFNVTIDIGRMLWQLLVTVTLPAAAGKALRELWPLAQRFATKYKEYLGMVSVLCLALVVWMSLSGAQAVLVQQRALDVLYMLLAALAQHVAYLAFNAATLALVVRVPIEEAVAVWVMASQKSAPVAITAITYITSDEAAQGLLSVPCILGQLLQIFVGAAYAPLVARGVARVQALRDDAAAAAAAAAAARKDVELAAAAPAGAPPEDAATGGEAA